jgi:hypothetical protein
VWKGLRLKNYYDKKYYDFASDSDIPSETKEASDSSISESELGL